MLTFAQDYRHPRLGASKPSLTLNKPGDLYEQEAERVADHVTGGPSLDGKVQAKAAGQEAAGPAAAPAQVQEVVSSPGQPLDRATRGLMESRFGHDFGNVRVHKDSRAAESARQINASAYTHGSDIVFAAGRYEPGSGAGQRLLAHELTHVVQQTGGGATAASGLVQRQPAGSTDLREEASPLLASALGSTTVDHFALGSAKIPSAGEDSFRYAARQILFFLKKYPASTVHITGYTDTLDSKSRNIELGHERADAVSAFLQKEGVPAEIISTESKGESDLAKPTANGVDEPLNRRVNVFFRVKKGGLSLGLDSTLKTPAAPEKEPPKKPILTVPRDIFDRPPGPPYRPPTLWDQMEENQRKIDSYKPPPTKSLGDVVIDGIMDNVAKPIIEKLPLSKDMKKKAEGLIRDGLETGTEKSCEAAIDALNAGDEVKEGLKEACKAAWKQKPK